MGSLWSQRNTLILCALAILASGIAARSLEPDRKKELAQLRAEAAVLYARQESAREIANEAASLLNHGDFEGWHRAIGYAHYLTPVEVERLIDIEERIRELQAT